MFIFLRNVVVHVCVQRHMVIKLFIYKTYISVGNVTFPDNNRKVSS